MARPHGQQMFRPGKYSGLNRMIECDSEAQDPPRHRELMRLFHFPPMFLFPTCLFIALVYSLCVVFNQPGLEQVSNIMLEATDRLQAHAALNIVQIIMSELSRCDSLPGC
jgi:hypothetical protein